MMLAKCRRCGTNVSSKAKNCPDCGISNPAKSNAGWIIGCVALLMAIVAITSPKKAPTNQQMSKDEEQEQYLLKNADNPFALDKKFSAAAQSACSSGADSYLRDIANYDFAWDSEADRWGIKFDKFSNTSAGPGLLTLMSTMAKLSNQFGAFNHIPLYCLYDARKDAVVGYSLSDPAVDIAAPEKQDQKSPSISYRKPASEMQNNSIIVVYDANAASTDPTELQND